MSYNKIDDKLWDVQMWLAKRHGLDEAARMMDPLRWYVETGRAPLTFLYNLLERKTFVIGRLLEKGGSTREVIDRVSTKFSMERA